METHLLEEIIKNYQLLINNPLFYFYFTCLMFDLISGNVKAFVNKEVDSGKGIKGTIKHFTLFLFVILVIPSIEIFFNNNTFSVLFLTYITYQYIISILENLEAMGFKFSPQIKQYFNRMDNDGQ